MAAHDDSPDLRIRQLDLQLPPPPPLGGVYQRVVVSGGLAWVSGHGPLKADGTFVVGRVGADLDLPAAKEAARQTGLAMLASLRAHFGSLDRVRRVVKLLGMVNSAPGFHQHPAVINGCSELFAQVWGDELGVGARSAVGMTALPGNIAVEIEGVFEVV